MAAQPEEVKVEELKEAEPKYDPKIEHILKTFYPAEYSEPKSPKEIAEQICAIYHENCFVMSISYHKEKSEFVPFQGKKNLVAYWEGALTKLGLVGYKCDISSVKLNETAKGLQFTVKHQPHGVNKEKEEIPVLNMKVEDTITLDADGKAVNVKTTTTDLDIAKLHQTQMVYKDGPNIDAKEGVATLICAEPDDEEQKDVEFTLDFKETIDKLKVQLIAMKINEAKAKKLEISIMVVQPELADGKKTERYVSHAMVTLPPPQDAQETEAPESEAK